MLALEDIYGMVWDYLVLQDISQELTLVNLLDINEIFYGVENKVGGNSKVEYFKIFNDCAALDLSYLHQLEISNMQIGL